MLGRSGPARKRARRHRIAVYNAGSAAVFPTSARDQLTRPTRDAFAQMAPVRTRTLWATGSRGRPPADSTTTDAVVPRRAGWRGSRPGCRSVSLVPCSTSRGTAGMSSSGARDLSGRPGRCSGNARQTIPATVELRSRSGRRPWPRHCDLRTTAVPGSAPRSSDDGRRLAASRRRAAAAARRPGGRRSARAARSAPRWFRRPAVAGPAVRDRVRSRPPRPVPQHQRRRGGSAASTNSRPRPSGVATSTMRVSIGRPQKSRSSPVDRAEASSAADGADASSASGSSSDGSLLLHLVDRGGDGVSLQGRRRR